MASTIQLFYRFRMEAGLKALLLMSIELNSAQKQAVDTLYGPLLILAGAGSGKTRILTQRIAHIIENGEAFPGEIFAVTFTNKAAREMRERVERLLHNAGIPAQDLWISTFHSSGAKILREHGHHIGLRSGFSIFDDSDQLSLIKKTMRDLNISDKIVSPQSVAYKLDQLKNDGIDPLEFEPTQRSFKDMKLAPILQAYERGLQANNALDFGDLVFKTLQLFKKVPAVTEQFQERFKFVLVDEYQDTNAAQYQFLRLLSQKYQNLCVVGDEDQSIYKWRGADIRNILDFEKDYPKSKLIKLEQNYRSSGHIIRAANEVISNNKQRKEKTLFTSNPEGPAVEVHFLDSDFEEARWVTKNLKQLMESENFQPRDIAIFYRTNAQSRLLEESLRYERLPFKVFGGMRFYDRAEVKDVLAYMRLILNPLSDVSLMRIINVPTRGIGDTTVEKCMELSRKERLPLLETLGLVVKGEGGLGSGPRNKIKAFLDLYANLAKQVNEMLPSEFYAYMLEQIGYVKVLKDENSIEAEARIENLKELASAITEYEVRQEQPTLGSFLEEVALVTDLDKSQAESSDYITLMTIHSAKGLEFPLVYLVGLEEDLFPSQRSILDLEGGGVEEERRLCYVGMTRAKQRLLLSSCHERRVFGVKHIRRPSRFIQELPQNEIHMQEHAERAPSRFAYQESDGTENSFGDFGDGFGGAFEEGLDKAWKKSSASFTQNSDRSPYQVGVKVNHPDYGTGTILSREGQNESLKVQVKFVRAGIKKFVVKYAPLEVLS